MPKRKNISLKLSNFVNDFKGVFELTEDSELNETLFCRYCKVNIVCIKRQHLEQHLSYSMHIKNTETNENDKKAITQQEFNEDLCRLFVATNTPTYRLRSIEWKRFIHKHTVFQCPDSIIKKNYRPSLYESTLEMVLEQIGDSDIWLSTDETKDRNGRHVVNVIVGSLDSDKPD